MAPDGYNTFGAMHGTIMVFFGIVPIAFAAFGNFVVPLQIGAPDMTFPRINMASYWCFFISCIFMLVSFLVPGGAAKSGWTSYPPLAGHRRSSRARTLASGGMARRSGCSAWSSTSPPRSSAR